jgi:hypothetical protein
LSVETPEPPPPGQRALGTSLLLALLATTALGATGRFRSALALTLGALVTIVSARWLSGVVGRLLATDPRKKARLGWKLALGAALRYVFLGLSLFAAVRLVPDEIPWLLAGLSAVVAGIVVEGIGEGWREAHRARDGSNDRGDALR